MKMKNKNSTWLRLGLFVIFIIIAFTASEFKGTVEEEVNVNIQIASPSENSNQYFSSDQDTLEVNIQIARNDNQELISLEMMDIPPGINYSFEPTILEMDERNSTLALTNISSLSGETDDVIFCAKAPGQEVCRKFRLSLFDFSLWLSADTVITHEGSSGSIEVRVDASNSFDCLVIITELGTPPDWFPFLYLLLQSGDTETISWTSPDGTAGNYEIALGGRLEDPDCSTTLLIDTTKFVIKIIPEPSDQWVDVTPSGYENVQYNDVHFKDSNFGLTVGSEGTIISTNDGGENWMGQTSGTDKNLLGVHSNGSTWYVSGSGIVLKNTGGIWEDVSQNLPNYNFSEVFVINVENVWITSANDLVYHTVNGGTDWTEFDPDQNEFIQLLGVWFNNSTTGTVTGNNGAIYRTTDDGTNWNLEYQKSTIFFWDVTYVNSTKGFAIGNQSTIANTLDGGETWSETSIVPAGYDLFAISFSPINTAVGLAAGWNGAILRTEDGGSNWFIELSSTTQSLNGIAVIDDNHGIAVGGGIILRRQ
jgi:photosystem II stability/assembly factor-like uncharacterized protein